jgi:hypothetical protein
LDDWSILWTIGPSFDEQCCIGQCCKNVGDKNGHADVYPYFVTELGLVPPSSVAVLLREMNPQEFKNGGGGTGIAGHMSAHG